MSKKLKLFGLLALVLALGAGVAWAGAPAESLEVPAGVTIDTDFMAKASDVKDSLNTIKGNGIFAGTISRDNTTNASVLKLIGGVTPLTVAPKTGKLISGDEGNEVLFQVYVDSGKSGKVIMKGANADAVASKVWMTRYHGGTFLASGTLGVTNNNALGQGVVAVLGADKKDEAPIFAVEGSDELVLGNPDPDGKIKQPVVLGFVSDASADVTFHKLDAGKVGTNLQRLILQHGLAQRVTNLPKGVTTDADYLASFDTPVWPIPGAGVQGFARLVKTGEGSLTINANEPILAALGSGPTSYDAFDGAHHRGGTLVEAGLLKMNGGNSTAPGSHFQGSLGKMWASFQGSQSLGASDTFKRADLKAKAMPKLYNPLWIKKGAQVEVNRSQFFSHLSMEKGSEFNAISYSLDNVNYYPQITVTLDQLDSVVDGVLKGKFHLVVDSEAASRDYRPGSERGRILSNRKAILFLNAENDIFASGDTLVADGVLQIASEKSIGGGTVTVGAYRGSDFNFETNDAATFAAAKTFTLPNPVVTKANSGLAAQTGAALTLRKLTLANGANVPLHVNSIDVNKMWTGRVEFGTGEGAVYSWTGDSRNSNGIKIDAGVLHLGAYPAPTPAQATANVKPFADVELAQGATLSLGDGVRDFQEMMDLKVGKTQSRIRVVVKPDDVKKGRQQALDYGAVFKARNIDYAALGMGDDESDNRLYLELDISALSNKLKKDDWINVVHAETAPDFDCLHYTQTGTGNEDKVKITVAFVKDGKVVTNIDMANNDEFKDYRPLDGGTKSILVPIVKDFDGTESGETKVLTAPLTASASVVSQDAEVTFTLGKWTYDGKDVDVDLGEPVVAGGTVKTNTLAADGKLVVTAGKANGTLSVTIPATTKTEPKVTGKAAASVSINNGGSGGGGGGGGSPEPGKNSGGGGCDAGFGTLGLALAAAFLLKRKA